MMKTKKITAALLACVLSAALIIGVFAVPTVASAATKNSKQVTYSLAGEYKTATNPAITKARKKLFNKAFKGFIGSTVTPVAYLGKQANSGTDHYFFCKIKASAKDAKEFYCVVIINKNKKGKVSIKEILDSEVETMLSEMSGGLTQPKSVKLTKTVKKAFNKAMKGLVGVDYTPIALISKQVVAGYKYGVLCESIGVYPGAVRGYSIVYVYKGVDGTVEATDIVEVTNLAEVSTTD